MNNPTLDDFCDNMIGRADIEESKSNCNRERDRIEDDVRMTVFELSKWVVYKRSVTLTVAMNAWLREV